MAEENKEVSKEEKPQSEAAAQTVPSNVPQAAGEPSVVPAKKEAAVSVKTKPANCADCNKPVRKKRWYYRDGSYYCTKRCWTSAKKKAEKPQETAPAR